MDQSLEAKVETISSLSLSELIPALASLASGLQPLISPMGDSLVTHRDYTGFVALDTFGRLYLDSGRRCTDESVPLHTRLQHASLLDRLFESLYVRERHFLLNAIARGVASEPQHQHKHTPTDEAQQGRCSCCRGDPNAVILAGYAEGEALYFTYKEYRALWGSQRASGGRTLYNRDGTPRRRWLKASRGQVEEALMRGCNYHSRPVLCNL
ncbi:hypothetical protein ASPZODRAFT_144926 [Penicilliopsis zonata CBS 506.65]|uniref:Uncharacterized protein n=1 Tax=Penicilliopsis zonata CBS 506.65 TaxID=1073090 RepID=A0A1L9SAY7_9EURO|nr:hypothetical protein ASPZODRAFT_144926 [Penicilliopsis zonata CBS 506.65]OJJ44352.1 hypothetical protein ASPZODRAFT_144926 [Penicilliopsis zonata CBS 506.65]